MGCIIKLQPDWILCESMNGIHSVTSEILVWKQEEEEEEEEESIAVKHNGLSSTNVEDSYNKKVILPTIRAPKCQKCCR